MAIPIRSTHQDEAAEMSAVVEIDIFIVGAGPAEAFPAAFLAQNSLTAVMIFNAPGTGNRLPYAWLMKGALPGKRLSTIDLAGHCAFSLLTGHGRNAWKLAAENASKVLGVPINCYWIGWGLDYYDVYCDWFKKREVEEDGMLLVRPDGYVACRSTNLIPNAEEKLLHVFRRILSRD